MRMKPESQALQDKVARDSLGTILHLQLAGKVNTAIHSTLTPPNPLHVGGTLPSTLMLYPSIGGSPLATKPKNIIVFTSFAEAKLYTTWNNVTFFSPPLLHSKDCSTNHQPPQLSLEIVLIDYTLSMDGSKPAST